jgi:hypothetical protein
MLAAPDDDRPARGLNAARVALGLLSSAVGVLLALDFVSLVRSDLAELLRATFGISQSTGEFVAGNFDGITTGALLSAGFCCLFRTRGAAVSIRFCAYLICTLFAIEFLLAVWFGVIDQSRPPMARLGWAAGSFLAELMRLPIAVVLLLASRIVRKQEAIEADAVDAGV